MKSNWTITPTAPEEFFERIPDVQRLVAQLLWNRGIRTQEAVGKFLSPSVVRDAHDPFLFTDMQKAVARVTKALAAQEGIALWGDYDCDGVCGTAILYHTLKELGIQHDRLNVHIPDRNKEGYGLTMGHLEELHREGVRLLITIDCGISSLKEIAWAKERGIDVIVVDHHNIPETLPPAYAILNPKDPRSGYPFSGLAGTGVAFKLATALASTVNCQLSTVNFLDLVAIATLADSMPLRDENRAFVHEGLSKLSHASLPGLLALLAFCGLAERFTVRDIHFLLIPRINAMGRMAHASVSFRLLTTAAEDEIATLIRHLDERNRERQLVTDVIVHEVLDRVSHYASKPSVVFEYSSAWIAGILGLAAQRVMDRVSRPVVLATVDAESGKVTASIRALGAFNVTEVLRAHPDLFLDGGGHPHAGGFTTTQEKIESVRKVFTDAANIVAASGGFDAEDAVSADAELLPSQLDAQTFQTIQALSPFGEENPEPQFLVKSLAIKHIRRMGEGEKHLRLRLAAETDGGVALVRQKRTGPDHQGTPGDLGAIMIDAVGFGFGERSKDLMVGSRVDVVGRLSKNVWNGRTSLELQLVDIG